MNNMLTSKQKRFLKSLGSVLEPVVQVGKAGLAASVISSAEDVLGARELIKVRVLQNSPEEPKLIITKLADALEAELVQVIGRNGLLFRRHAEKPVIEMPQ